MTINEYTKKQKENLFQFISKTYSQESRIFRFTDFVLSGKGDYKTALNKFNMGKYPDDYGIIKILFHPFR